MRMLLSLIVAMGATSPAQAADEILQSKVAAAVQAARANDKDAFADLVRADAKLDVYKQPLASATMESLRQAFEDCKVRPMAAEGPADQVTQLWDCKESPTLAAFNFKDGKIVLVRTLPNFRPISPPSTEKR